MRMPHFWLYHGARGFSVVFVTVVTSRVHCNSQFYARLVAGFKHYNMYNINNKAVKKHKEADTKLKSGNNG